METKAIVIAVDGEYATVRADRKSACDGCHKNKADGGCAMCTILGDKKALDSRAKNTVGAKPGDVVLLESESKKVLGYAALVFLMPIALGLLFYLFSRMITDQTALQYIFMLIGFAGSFVFLWLYSRHVIAKRCDVVIKEILTDTVHPD
ncbi:MAG: SoxR reducing system RseC family protein [Clostridia bacterium]|nr:SoxR reducing system RseC family protein [Clostridia bacterium]